MFRLLRLPRPLLPGLFIAVFIAAVAAMAVIGPLIGRGGAGTAHAQPVCGLIWQEVTVCIELMPDTDSNLVGTDHTVTATVTEDGEVPTMPWTVAFSVAAGPNAGAVGACDPVSCDTDAAGQVDFTYTDAAGVVATDTITGCIVEPNGVDGQLGLGVTVPSPPAAICDEVDKDWYVPTPTPEPTPTPTATPAPSPTPTPTPEAAPAAEMPATGGQPPDGGSSSLPWLAAITGAIAVISASSFWFAYQRRRVR